MLRESCRWLVLLTVACIGSSVAVSQGAPPWYSLVPFKKVEADTKKDYALSKSYGPWMIMAMSFSGDEAEDQARQLVLELRRDYKLEAWMHKHEVELEDTVEGLGVDQFGRPKKMKYQHGNGLSDIAVLVGNFKSFEDPAANSVLEKIRFAKPKCLSGGVAQRSGFGIRDAYVRASQGTKAKRGPLGRAFITRNPMLPQDETAKQTLDSFVIELNAGIDHTLLANPATYTVQIATFRGATSYDEKEFAAKQSQNGLPQIHQACINAGTIAAQLRKKGVEAYVFHDRNESIVTVGGFNDVGQEMPNGRIELRPEIARIVREYEAKKSNIAGAGQVGLVPQQVAGIALDVSPRLIQVPKKSIADVYRQ